MTGSSDDENNPFKIDLPVDPLGRFTGEIAEETPPQALEALEANEPEFLTEAVPSLEPLPEPLAEPVFEAAAEMFAEAPQEAEPALPGPELTEEKLPEMDALEGDYATPGSAAFHESLESADSHFVPEENLELASEPEPVIETPPPASPKALTEVKKFSDQLGAESAKASVPASFPFSVMIEGKLSPSDREKLTDVIASEDFGIREIDLEPQLEAGRILIPRISEYAGILLIQALRNLPVKMRMGPADEIYQKLGSADPEDSIQPPETQMSVREMGDSASADLTDTLPLTSEAAIMQLPYFSIIDTLTASATLKSSLVEAEKSAEYNLILENLKRELKHKALRRGASGLIHFKIELTSLSLPSHYLLHVQAVAIKAEELNPFGAENRETRDTQDGHPIGTA